MNQIIFKDELHKQRYIDILSKMRYDDVYHKAFAYLIALDDNIVGSRIDDCFNFSEDIIKTKSHPWHTGFDRCVLKLANHLWNSAQPIKLDDVFYHSNQEYFIQAIRIRYDF